MTTPADDSQANSETPEGSTSYVTSEKEAQEALSQAYQEAAPEPGILNQMLMFGLGVSATVGWKRAEVIKAFSAVNGKNFQHDLLKVVQQEKFLEAEENFEIVKKEVEEKRAAVEKKRKELLAKGKQQEADKLSKGVKVGAWRFSETMTFEEFDRKSQAYTIGKAVQNKITGAEINIKIDRVVDRFSLNKTNEASLRHGMAKWLRENPGKSIDDYLLTAGTKLHLSQNGLEEKKLDKTKKQELAKQKASLAKEFKTARKEAIQKHKKSIIAGQGAIRDNLSGNQPILTQEQLNAQRLAVAKGTYQAQTPIPQGQQPQAQLQPQTAVAPQIPTQPVVAPTTQTSQPQVSLGLATRFRGFLQTRFNIRLPVFDLSIGQQWLSGFIGRFAFLQGAKLAVRNFAAFSLISLRGALSGTALRSLIRPAFQLGKAVVGGGLAGVSLGTSLLITAALTLAEKLPLIGGVIQGAEKFIMIILLLAIGIPIAILVVGGGVFMATLTTKPTFLRATDNAVLSWSEFSKQNLTISSPSQLSWEQFEKNNLNPSKQYLSLDTNGHDNVKK